MPSFNEITVVGYLGKDPELRYLPDGNGVCNFSVATTEKRTVHGAKEEHTIWFKVTVWGKRGENCNEYLRKGSQVYVRGTLRQESYTDRDGNPRTSLVVRADTVNFLSTRNGSGDGGEESPRNHTARSAGQSTSPDEQSSWQNNEDDDIPF